MMKTTLHIIKAATIAAATAMLSSCEHKELCYDHVHNVTVNVVFDWNGAPDANPAGMHVYFFPAGGGQHLRFGLAGRDGGQIEIPDGTYDIICINSDSETAQLRGTDSFSTFEIFTRDASLLEGMGLLAPSRSPIVEGTENESVTLAPDLIYNGKAESIKIPFSREQQTVTLHPMQTVCNYSFDIINVENLKYVSSMSASLSGMSGSYLAGADQSTEEPHTVPFEAAPSGETTISGQFHVFGHCPGGNGNKHIFALYVVQNDGKQVYYTFDVTGQIHSAPDKNNVHILIDGLTLPRPIVNGGGIKPSVDEWEDVEVNIPM